MKVKMGVRWRLRRLMADHDMYPTSNLVPLLAERGVHLSREQVYRLVTQTPQRLSMDTLAALCDILACTPNDLIDVELVNAPAALPPDKDCATTLTLLDHEDVARQLRSCLHDNSLPLDVRVAGGLVLLFGMRASRVVQITVDTVICRTEDVFLAAGRAPIRIPPPLDRLLIRLAARPRDPVPLSRAVGPTRYLFPGAAPGRPIRSQGMRNRLRRYGITAEPGQQTAVLALTADLPAPVVADLLGINVDTALRWANHTAPDWAAQVDARDDTPGRQRTKDT